jgi:histidyl-tRNA synthetase
VEGVERELTERGLPPSAVAEFVADASADDPVAAVVERVSATDAAAVAEVRAVEELVAARLRGGSVTFDPFIARGLDYYTGPVFEIFYDADPDALPLSIAGGGRYDELLGTFGREQVPATGASLGLERILLLLGDEHAGRRSIPEVLVTVWDEESRRDAVELAGELRDAGISTETYIGDGALKAQLRYASRRGARFCVIAGPDERQRGEVSVRDLESGEQSSGARASVVDLVRGGASSQAAAYHPAGGA